MEGIEYTSKIIYGKEVLYRSFGGELTAEAEIQMLQYALDKGLINDKVIGMVLDMSRAQFNMQPGDGLKIIFPLLGGIKREGAKLKPFSTEQAALKWILT